MGIDSASKGIKIQIIFLSPLSGNASIFGKRRCRNYHTGFIFQFVP